MTIHVKRILLVEDDPRDVELMLQGLSEFNLANEVCVAREGEEALNYLYRRQKFSERGNGNPALILLDIKMPKLSGLEVLRVIKNDEQLRSIPVVMLTSSKQEPDLMESYKLGVNAYVVKPIQFHDFVDAVKLLGMFWAVLNEPPPVKS